MKTANFAELAALLAKALAIAGDDAVMLEQMQRLADDDPAVVASAGVSWRDWCALGTCLIRKDAHHRRAASHGHVIVSDAACRRQASAHVARPHRAMDIGDLRPECSSETTSSRAFRVSPARVGATVINQALAEHRL